MEKAVLFILLGFEGTTCSPGMEASVPERSKSSWLSSRLLLVSSSWYLATLLSLRVALYLCLPFSGNGGILAAYLKHSESPCWGPELTF